ncbi:hypothetical protein [Sinirhodobacter huangdaonensis]|uniref:Uncharacterized protein n=1 Tax=Paenirhodobacter huangdaonensis TaxID=2501515 RepID=A0A443LXW2_9RHOB|nr:hypothetical protein [Sinirhodobacter huangdaonensis]RWR54063.1 hypothetical protein EOW66_05500 [Sinirhodobacter huangdaonensis]
MINLSAGERDAIEDMDVDALRIAIEEARKAHSSTAVTRLQLYRLGAYVQEAERRFDLALANLRKAKAAAKIASTEQATIRAGWDLASAVDQMKDRARQERRDGERFYVDDHIHEPFTFQPEMTVSVSYRWRATEDDGWSYGRIVFHHHHVARPQPWDFADRRRLTARQREKELSETLQREWYRMRDLALFSVRDFFRDGGNGADIPETFDAVADRGSLNNFSLNFWA